MLSGRRLTDVDNIPGGRDIGKGPEGDGSLLHPRDLREVVGEGLDAARRLTPIVLLVRRVVAVLGEAEADADDRRLEVFLHGDDGPERAARAAERAGGAAAAAHGRADG